MFLLDKEIKKSLGSLDPLAVLDQWLKKALRIKNLKDPWVMVLSTSFKGRVSSRSLLLKEFYKGKLFFYTNYLSQKGRDIKNNPLSAVHFYWPVLDRQIRIEGLIRPTNRAKSLAYWKTRSRSSQLSQWVSKQSQIIPSRKKLEDLKKLAENKFRGKKIPCPKHWGGYALSIQKIEFWKNQPHRLHDRFVFEKKARGWKRQRLYP